MRLKEGEGWGTQPCAQERTAHTDSLGEKGKGIGAGGQLEGQLQMARMVTERTGWAGGGCEAAEPQKS